MSIKVPQQGKFLQPNTSDLFGNLWYTKNMNFDEAGYAKLSSRVVSALSEADDDNFNIPISYGRTGNEFHIVTADQPYDLSIAENNFSVVEDTNSNNPSLSFDSWGRWYQNRWHATTNTKIWYTTGGAWTDTGVSLTTGKVHALEEFKNKNSLAVSNGDSVKLLDTSYATTITLSGLPTGMEIVGLSYSNGKMGIITMMSDSAAGQNQEAFFCVWDGSSASAGIGVPVGSDTILSIVAYKSSWAILTRTGELKYWNGGGFETLATLPFAIKNTTWGDSQNRITHGDTMIVQSDKIFINIGNDYEPYGRKGEFYIQNNPAGVWCYDPNVGLYHRYAPSISQAYQIAVSAVNTGTDIMTATGTIPATGNPIKCVNSVTSPIGGVKIGQVYFIIKHSATTFSLAESRDLALAGVKLNLTSDTTANFIGLNVLDFGASKCDRVGGIGVVEYRRETADHLVFGSEMRDFDDASTSSDQLNITTTRFENRGYLVTAKAVAPGITDNAQKVYIKYRPLDVNDKFILKYKEKDVLGLPTSTPQWVSTTSCEWTSNDEFTTTADLSEVESYFNDGAGECEVEIIAGAGAGQIAYITSIDTDGTNYAVTLSEPILGAQTGYSCDISIDNWKLLKTTEDASAVTYLDTEGYKEFPIETSSKWILLKVEFQGSETCLEEIDLVKETQLASS